MISACCHEKEREKAWICFLHPLDSSDCFGKKKKKKPCRKREQKRRILVISTLVVTLAASLLVGNLFEQVHQCINNVLKDLQHFLSLFVWSLASASAKRSITCCSAILETDLLILRKPAKRDSSYWECSRASASFSTWSNSMAAELIAKTLACLWSSIFLCRERMLLFGK